VENGVNYFEKKGESGELYLQASGKGSENVVTADTTVTLNPRSPEDDPVELKEEGDYVIVKITHEGQVDVYKIGKKAKIIINSDNVTGDDIEDANISVGAGSSKVYISEEKIGKIGNKIQNSVGLVGYAVSSWEEYEVDGWGPGFMDADSVGIRDTGSDAGGGTKYTVGYRGREGSKDSFNKWVVEAQAEMKDVKEVLQLMAQAIKEEDDDKKSKKWDVALDAIGRWNTQHEKKGETNNRDAFLVNVLMGELGEEGFKDALQLGIIPTSFAKKIAEGLMAEATEVNNTTTELQWQFGANGWTHQSKADWINKYAGTSPDPVEDKSGE
jgi:hypothetical protein